METELFVLAGQKITGLVAALGAGLLLAGLIAGWILSRRGRDKGLDQNGGKTPVPRSPSDDAFLKGVTHMMADHTDQAIEEFTRAVTLNSDTVETYVVLGNLFRQKGEIERAVRIRQNIIARPHLETAIKLQAQFDLGLDYKKGGLLSRAADAFKEVLNMDAKHVEALRQMVTLYEEMREWDNAYDTLKRLDKLTGSDNRQVLAHYRTERGKELLVLGQLDAAEDLFGQAMSVHKGCLDAYLHMGDLHLARSRNKKALNVWRKAVQLRPHLVHLVVTRLAKAEQALGKTAVDEFMAEIEVGASDQATLLAMAQYYRGHSEDEQALKLVELAVSQNPAHLQAQRLLGEILLEKDERFEAMEAYAKLLQHIGADLTAYQCRQCGQVTHELSWKCPRCQHWDTIEPRQPMN